MCTHKERKKMPGFFATIGKTLFGHSSRSAVARAAIAGTSRRAAALRHLGTRGARPVTNRFHPLGARNSTTSSSSAPVTNPFHPLGARNSAAPSVASRTSNKADGIPMGSVPHSTTSLSSRSALNQRLTVTAQMHRAPSTMTLRSQMHRAPSMMSLRSQMHRAPSTMSLRSQMHRAPSTMSLRSRAPLESTRWQLSPIQRPPAVQSTPVYALRVGTRARRAVVPTRGSLAARRQHAARMRPSQDSSATAGNTTVKMQRANRQLLRTVAKGLRRTGRTLKRVGGAFGKAVRRTGRWAKKHKTELAIAALTTGGVGGVTGAVQAVADYNAAKRDAKLLEGTAAINHSNPGFVMEGGSSSLSSLGNYENAGPRSSYVRDLSRYGSIALMHKQIRRGGKIKGKKTKRKARMAKKRRTAKMSKQVKLYLQSLRKKRPVHKRTKSKYRKTRKQGSTKRRKTSIRHNFAY